MDTFLIILSYLFIATWTWTKIYHALYVEHRKQFPTLTWDDGDRTFGVLWGGFVALCWPLAWTCYAIYMFCKHVVAPFCKPLFKNLERLEN